MKRYHAVLVCSVLMAGCSEANTTANTPPVNNPAPANTAPELMTVSLDLPAMV